MLGETVICATVSLQLNIPSFHRLYIQEQCYPLLRQLHTDFVDFNSTVCRAIWKIVAESNPDRQL